LLYPEGLFIIKEIPYPPERRTVMERKKSVLLSLFSLLALAWILSGSDVSAQPPKDDEKKGMKHPWTEPRGGMPHGGGLPHSMTSYLKERLGLDESQVEKLKKVHSDYEKTMVRKHADVHVAEMELGDVLQQKNVDMNAVEKAVRKIESLRSDISLYRVKSLLDTRSFLTDEQYQKFREYTVERYPMMRGGMGSGGYGGYGGYGYGVPGHEGMPGMMPPGHRGRVPGMMPGYDDYEDDRQEGEQEGEKDRKSD
jgi:Spy/CpxP family protein refolding chaperone